MQIREAKRGDEYAIMELIRALSVYEKAPDQVVNTAEDLGRHLFDERICEALVVDNEGFIVGFALYFTNYSTWKGKCLYLEDFYVLSEFRRTGIGSRLFDKVVGIAKARGAKRMDWQVLEWNESALEFYRKKSAFLDSEWINGRLFF
jgi:GNAT superfamily N-acetyltransferase